MCICRQPGRLQQCFAIFSTSSVVLAKVSHQGTILLTRTKGQHYNDVVSCTVPCSAILFSIAPSIEYVLPRCAHQTHSSFVHPIPHNAGATRPSYRAAMIYFGGSHHRTSIRDTAILSKVGLVWHSTPFLSKHRRSDSSSTQQTRSCTHLTSLNATVIRQP
jgi:hypothetical protein